MKNLKTFCNRFLLLSAIGATLGMSACKKSDSASPSNNNNPNTGDAYKDGLPDVITVIKAGVEAAKLTFTYNSDGLPTNVVVTSVDTSETGTYTMTYSGQQLSSLSSTHAGRSVSSSTYTYDAQGNLSQSLSISEGSYKDTSSYVYNNGKLIAELRKSGNSYNGSTNYSKDSLNYFYGSKPVPDSSHSYYASRGQRYDVTDYTQDSYAYDANNRLVSITNSSHYGSNTYGPYYTKYWYPEDLVGSRTDLTMKNVLLKATDIPYAVAKNIGIGYLFTQSGSSLPTNANPYTTTRTTVDNKPTYKITSSLEPSTSYIQIKMK